MTLPEPRASTTTSSGFQGPVASLASLPTQETLAPGTICCLTGGRRPTRPVSVGRGPAPPARCSAYRPGCGLAARGTSGCQLGKEQMKTTPWCLGNKQRLFGPERFSAISHTAREEVLNVPFDGSLEGH